MAQIFTGSFTQQEPLAQASIDAALRVMQSGRLHRYNVIKGEVSEVALLEKEFAAYMGAQYCLAVASGGYALTCALKAIGVVAGDKILSNAFTLAPVPGAIAGAGCQPVFVEMTKDLVIDFDHLERMIVETGAKILMLSHMRGHICDMDCLMAICNSANVKVIEDCAHTMGATWDGVKSGRHGLVACYSTQTYKHLNSGEGGLIVSDDADMMARATILSGSYMLYDRHIAGPDKDVFVDIRLETPNCSGRMDNLRAAILRPQLAQLDRQCGLWNERHKVMQDGLRGTRGVRLIDRPAKEGFVASSFQFSLPEFDKTAIEKLLEGCAQRGVELKWFGETEPHGYTSNYMSWTYAKPTRLPQTDGILAGLMDLRLPLTFSLEDYRVIAAIIREEIELIFPS